MLVEALLQHGADINAVNNDNISALVNAILHGKTKFTIK